jgi:peptidoglycan/LPS O-acetylase OafA/YrhL
LNINYRPEIDGLRTIAVLSVIIYHAEFTLLGTKLLPGGFLGVDIFFVISGFLISSIIIRELQSTGRFSFADFYERRARRILPALFVVIFFSIPFAWWLLLPEQIIDFAKSILSSISFISNIYWLSSLQEYGAESASLKPLLHTWSLAVEEQFYILFPFVLLFLFKRNHNHAITLL